VVRLISSNLQTLNVYQGLTKAHLDSQLKRMYPAGLLCDPRTKALVLNGKPGHLQMYSVHSDRQLFNVSVGNFTTTYVIHFITFLVVKYQKLLMK